jgi:hypothetical protein
LDRVLKTQGFSPVIRGNNGAHCRKVERKYMNAGKPVTGLVETASDIIQYINEGIDVRYCTTFEMLLHVRSGEKD